jgi:prophage maintenance system killer protein
MAFTDELENKIQSVYYAILKKRALIGTGGKTLNCDSFRRIAEEVKSVIRDGLNAGESVLEISNNIIFKILKTNFFVYANHEMAALIGYIYLTRQGVKINHYSVNGLNNNSTIEDIRTLTASW